VVTSGLRFTETPPVVGAAAPRLGEHTFEVLQRELGMSESEIGQLVERGVLEYRPAAGNEVAVTK
jgi:crotonobetainyl-CoA:carnitine CoA-transferase CaiB-like acyl-CoA transferase